VGTALAAMQVGDITRQRLEHVRMAPRRWKPAGRSGGGRSAGTRGHMLRLLAINWAI
jgi:hypothetical protein